MPVRVLVLGAGFGGLELSSRLAEGLGDDVRVTLIDKSDAFVFGFSKLDVMFGRQTMDEVRLPYRDIAWPNVQFRQETVVSIDAEHKRVVTDNGAQEGDIVGKVDVSFLSGPAPVSAYTPPSLEGAEEKREFAATRRRRWFGEDKANEPAGTGALV